MRLLLFVTKAYSFSILQPVQIAAELSNHSVKWFTANSARKIDPPGECLRTSSKVEEYEPHAVIVPGNVVPDFWPGIKAQIFHGLGEEKRGHYRITNFFDLYCTPGPFMTKKFNALAKQHGSFIVKETGWPKLDIIDTNKLTTRKQEFEFDHNNPVILFAPTFSPRYTSAIKLFEEIKILTKSESYSWLIKFHPKMDKDSISIYEELGSDNVLICKDEDIIPCLEAADVLITDTSSVAYEYLLLNRPIITYKATTRKNKGIDIQHADELKAALTNCLKNPKEHSQQRKQYLQELHPYNDGQSSRRIIECINEMLETDATATLKPKKPNWMQKRQIRKMVS